MPSIHSYQVGRIIGKGGQNVRELQRVTGSIIKLPEHGTAPAEEETTVHIIGPFFSVQVNNLKPFLPTITCNSFRNLMPILKYHLLASFQSAQRRIRAMILSTNPPPAPKKGPRPPKDTSPSGGAPSQQAPPQQQQQLQQPTPQSSQ